MKCVSRISKQMLVKLEGLSLNTMIKMSAIQPDVDQLVYNSWWCWYILSSCVTILSIECLTNFGARNGFYKEVLRSRRPSISLTDPNIKNIKEAVLKNRHCQIHNRKGEYIWIVRSLDFVDIDSHLCVLIKINLLHKLYHVFLTMVDCVNSDPKLSTEMHKKNNNHWTKDKKLYSF